MSKLLPGRTDDSIKGRVKYILKHAAPMSADAARRTAAS
jgi:hypothetical protein